MITIGLDIGIKGGVAVAYWAEEAGVPRPAGQRPAWMTPARMTVVAMPTMVGARKGQRRTDGRVLGDMLAAVVVMAPAALAVVERVHAMPKQGVSSTFAFGKSAGVVDGVLAALHVPVLEVEPARWKRDMALPADKQAVMAAASRLLPAWAHLWAGKTQDGLAEAAMLALWARWRGVE